MLHTQSYDTEKDSYTWLVPLLVLLGVGARLTPHPWNVSPVAAFALFSGTILPKRWSLIVPLATMIISDYLIGLHATVPFTWGAVLLISFLGWLLRDRFGWTKLLGTSLLGSCLFFLITNFGVWAIGDWYPRTAEGLWTCYVAGIPYFRGTLLGDLACSFGLFGLLRAAMALGWTRPLTR